MTSTEAPVAVDYAQYADKKVIVTVGTPDNDQPDRNIEGTVQAANAMALLIKLKGKSQTEPIFAKDIISIELAPDANRALTQRYLKEVKVGEFRQHLVDRHGFLLDAVNADDFTEEKAAAVHAEQHEKQGAQLGHVHGEKPKTNAEKAIENVGSADTPEQAAEQLALAESDNDPAAQPGDEDNEAF
jgi:hypothetical protein